MNDEIFFKPRTGEEMVKATHAPIYLYSQMCENVERSGVGRVLSDLFSKSPKAVILLQNPSRMSSGHWMGLSIKPATKEIYFFSSYGGRPDFEKNEWLSEDSRIQSGQNTNALNDGLKQMAERGWKVHYNDHPYQFVGDGSATCGIWTAAFLNSDMNPDEFWTFNHLNHLGARDYFFAYFH